MNSSSTATRDRRAARARFDYSSSYIETRDGVKLAADIFLPKRLSPDIRVPTILYLTRYVRTFELREPFSWFGGPLFGQIKKKEIKYFVGNGYACVIVDVRGTGASFGTRRMEFSPEEIRDGADIADWITKQTWSNGNIGTTGISYLGTTAEMMLVNQHPAVKACVPRSSIFDLYGDIVFPGGVRHGKFIKVWRDTTYSLDNNRLGYVNKLLPILSKGAKSVGKDRRRRNYKAAKKEHRDNFDIFAELDKITYRNEEHPSLGIPIDHFSVHNYAKEIEGSGTPIFRIGGWYDGALANSVIKGLLNTKNTESVLIGPWDHGPAQNISPFKRSNKMTFDVLPEIVRFFDRYLKDGKDARPDAENSDMPRIRYFTLGDEQWRSAETWPVPEATERTLYFSADGKLKGEADAVDAGTLHHKVDPGMGTGGGARWNSLTIKYRYKKWIRYPDRHLKNERMLVFQSDPLKDPLCITGHPLLDLVVASDASDMQLFVYLEERLPDGKVRYITEGLVRGIHKQVSPQLPFRFPHPKPRFHIEDHYDWKPNTFERVHVDMIPISYTLQPGSTIQVSMTAKDVDHFDDPDEAHRQMEELRLKTGMDAISKITLPVIQTTEG